MNNRNIPWSTCFRVGVSALLIYIAITYWSGLSAFLAGVVGAASPLVIGGVIAYLVNILMVKYEGWFFSGTNKKVLVKLRRPVCMTGAFITLIAVIAVIFALVIPQLVSCLALLLKEIPGFIKDIIAWVDERHLLSEEIINQLMSIDWKSRLGQIFELVTSGIGSVVDVVVSTVTSLFSIVVTGLISVIFAIYALSSKERISSQIHRLMKRFMKELWYKRVLHISAVADESFRGYIVGQCTEAVILGCLCTIGMWILQLPYAPMVGAFIAFTALIPVAGAYIGAIVGAFMILTVEPVKALIFLIFIIILQQIEGNAIFPKVVGSSIGLPGIWVLAAVTIGGGVMGVVGMLIGVPIAATIYKLLKEQVENPENILTTDPTRPKPEPEPLPSPPPKSKAKAKTLKKTKK